MKTLVGIDPSLKSTGVVVGNTDGFKSYSVPSEREGKSVFDRVNRMDYITRQVFLLLRDYQIDEIWIEGYSFGSKGNLTILAELGGILRLRLSSLCKNIFEVPPTHWKTILFGKPWGHATKDKVAEFVQEKWGKTFYNQDECDAFCIFQYGLGKNDPKK